MRSKTGRMTRSTKGSDISISSRVISWSANWARRVSSRFACGVVNPWKMRKMPNATTRPSRMVTALMCSDLDLDDLLDDGEADGHGEAAHRQHDDAEGLVEHRREVVRRDHREDSAQADGKHRDDPPRRARLCGKRPDLTLDAHPFADGVGDGVEDLGQVSADDAVDLDGRDHQVEVLGRVALHHVVESVIHVDAEGHL